MKSKTEERKKKQNPSFRKENSKSKFQIATKPTAKEHLNFSSLPQYHRRRVFNFMCENRKNSNRVRLN